MFRFARRAVQDGCFSAGPCKVSLPDITSCGHNNYSVVQGKSQITLLHIEPQTNSGADVFYLGGGVKKKEENMYISFEEINLRLLIKFTAIQTKNAKIILQN